MSHGHRAKGSEQAEPGSARISDLRGAPFLTWGPGRGAAGEAGHPQGLAVKGEMPSRGRSSDPAAVSGRHPSLEPAGPLPPTGTCPGPELCVLLLPQGMWQAAPTVRTSALGQPSSLPAGQSWLLLPRPVGRRPARTGPPAPRAESASRELTAWASTGPGSLPGGPGAQQPHLCEVPGASRWGRRMELTPRLSGLSPGCRASNCAPPPTGPRGAGWCFEKPCTVTPFPVLGPGGGAEPCEKPCRRQSARGGPRRRRCAAETWRALAGEAPGAEGLVSAGVSGLVWAVLPAPSQRPATGL